MIPPATTFQENSSNLNIILVNVQITALIGINTAQVTALTFLIEMVLSTQHKAVHTIPRNNNMRIAGYVYEKYKGLSNDKE